VIAKLPRWLPDDLAETFREGKLVGEAGPLRDGLERQRIIPQQSAGVLDSAEHLELT